MFVLGLGPGLGFGLAEHDELLHVLRRLAARGGGSSGAGRALQAELERVGRREQRALPGVPRYAVRTVRPRLARAPSTCSAWRPGGRLPCASGTYTTREAGTRSPYVPNGGTGAYVSAQRSASAAAAPGGGRPRPRPPDRGWATGRRSR